MSSRKEIVPDTASDQISPLHDTINQQSDSIGPLLLARCPNVYGCNPAPEVSVNDNNPAVGRNPAVCSALIGSSLCWIIACSHIHLQWPGAGPRCPCVITTTALLPCILPTRGRICSFPLSLLCGALYQEAPTKRSYPVLFLVFVHLFHHTGVTLISPLCGQNGIVLGV
jgi:hypothetical protein